MDEIRSPKSSVEWEEYYGLRYEILRKPLGQKLGSEKNDSDSNGLHFALYHLGQLTAIGRLDKVVEGISQVRFFCTSKEAQGKGFGRQLMLEMELYASKRGDSKMILHARELALPFYLSIEYTVVEKSHLLFEQVQHFLMEKKI